MGTIYDIITSIDRGTSVGVNYRGKSSYKTCCGAFLSLLLYGSVIAYGVYLVLQLVGQKTPQVS